MGSCQWSLVVTIVTMGASFAGLPFLVVKISGRAPY